MLEEFREQNILLLPSRALIRFMKKYGQIKYRLKILRLHTFAFTLRLRPWWFFIATSNMHHGWVDTNLTSNKMFTWSVYFLAEHFNLLTSCKQATSQIEEDMGWMVTGSKLGASNEFSLRNLQQNQPFLMWYVCTMSIHLRMFVDLQESWLQKLCLILSTRSPIEVLKEWRISVLSFFSHLGNFLSCPITFCTEWTNGWMNERTNKQMNERMRRKAIS